MQKYNLHPQFYQFFIRINKIILTIEADNFYIYRTTVVW